MPKKSRQPDMFAGTALALKPAKEKKREVQHVTRSTDGKGRLTDYIRHEACGGHGCKQCDGLGFTKQLVAL